MRTTLKRGLGRAAAPNGNGKPVLPPGSISPVTVYRQTCRRAARAWRGSAARSRGPGSWRSCSWRGRPAARTSTSTSPSPRSPRRHRRSGAPRRQLDVPLPGQPAVALVIGYDHRAADGKGAPSRSDTLMLVPRRPGDRLDLAALVPARHARRDPLSGAHAVHRARSTRPTCTAARRGRCRRSRRSRTSTSTT